MYYIYHIPGVKYGMTKKYPQRCIDQGFTNYELTETHSDIMVGSEREKELNLNAGYPWNDSQYYYLMVERGSNNKGNANIHQRKLTYDIAQKIKSKYIPRIYGMQKLADEYGVSLRVIQQIILGITYTKRE